MKDVAKRAGVSYTTVSKVLNNYDEISEETKKRVLEVIEEMDFIPKQNARELNERKRRKTLAFIFTGLERGNRKDTVAMDIMWGLFRYSQDHHYELVFYPITQEIQRTKSYLQFCRENNIAGAILLGQESDDKYFVDLVNSEMPCVVIDVLAQDEKVSSLSIDNEQAAREAVNCLIDNGHTKIAIVNGRQKSMCAILRQVGYQNALQQHGIELCPDYILDGDFSELVSYQQTLKLLQEHPEVTAFFCSSDIMAYGVYRAAKELGLRIPEELSVIGFDDNPFAGAMTPPLTTIRQDFFVFGYTAADLLVELTQNPETRGTHTYLDYELVVRQSVGNIKPVK